MPKKRVLFLFDAKSLEKDRSTRVFTETTNRLSRKADVYLGALDKLEFMVSHDRTFIYDPVNKVDLKDYDLVYFRAWAASKATVGICSLYLDHFKVPYFDSEAASDRSFSKLEQCFKLWHAGFLVPATFLGAPESTVDKMKDNSFSFPVILKGNVSTRGQDNYLVHDLTEMEKILSVPLEDGQLMLQQFIPNTCDYRILIFNSEPQLIIQRCRDVTKTHLNNTSQGARANLIPIESFDPKVIEAAVAASIALKREIAGVDIVIDETNGRHYFLEINRKPQLIEGSFIDEKMKKFAEFIDKIA